MPLVSISSHLKTVPRNKFLIFDARHPDVLYLRQQGCEDPWLHFPKPKRGPWAKGLGNTATELCWSWTNLLFTGHQTFCPRINRGWDLRLTTSATLSPILILSGTGTPLHTCLHDLRLIVIVGSYLALCNLSKWNHLLNLKNEFVCVLLGISPASVWTQHKYINNQTLHIIHTSYLHPALEDGTDRGFRNVGRVQTGAGDISKRTHTILKTRRKPKIKIKEWIFNSTLASLFLQWHLER